MKKLISTIILFASLTSIVFANFNDVNSDHKNYDAIIYLQNNEVINGYPDGTFKPDNFVNRVEFLKIILEGSDIPLNVTSNTNFNDVDHNQWYGPYLKKAYQEGWINGYPDGTFKPELNINKVEALKIIGEVQNWELENEISTAPYIDTDTDQWYIAYLSYAKEHDYLEETGTSYFPAEKMTRAGIAEVIYRTMTDEEETTEEDTTEEETTEEETTEEETTEEETTEEETTAEETTEEETTELDFQPVTFNTSIASFFDDIVIDEEIPNIFYQNEVYIFSGEVSNENEKKATIFYYDDDDNQYSFSKELDNNEFQIPVFFSEPGNYTLGIIPGISGSTKAISISVLPSLPDNSNSNGNNNLENLEIKYQNSETQVIFNSENSTLKLLNFIQDNETVQYISRQNIEYIPINYIDFKDFSEDEVEYYVEYADLSSIAPLEISSKFDSTNTEEFDATYHTFSAIEEDEITTSVPETLDNTGEFSFSGTVNIDTKIKGYVIKPDGFVEDLELTTTSSTSDYYGSEVIDNGGDFTFTYNPSSYGTYIVEINNNEGIATLNHPIYIGNDIPLLPDFFDLNERELFSGTLIVENLREDLLNLINDTRTELGLTSIELSNEINNLAQNHTDDMADNNYFSHINLSGETPDDRRLNLGINTGVSENIAKETSVEFAHYGLLRSAAHKANILNPEWERVGLGITEKDGYLYIAEEFSTFELTEADLNEYKDELFEEINDLREDSSVADLSYSLALASASEYINQQILEEGATLDNDLFSDSLSENNINGASELTISTSESWNSILDSVLSDVSNLILSQWENIGIDIQTNDTGTIQTIYILNDPI